MDKLTPEEKITNEETRQHIRYVAKNLHIIVKHLLDRADNHDKSKLSSPEVEIFTQVTANLSKLTYGSEEYEKQLADMKPALDHHYANNRHHSSHFRHGVKDMNLVDIIEMFCDWQAAGKRHADGNLRKSIEVNAKKYNISPQLVSIFENSMELFE